MNDWDIYDSNLPKSTTSVQLIPYYREGLLFNGTNRSAYEIDYYENSPPSAQISADRLEVDCISDTVQFIDHSALRLSSATWQWTFPGGTPSSSTQEDPVVVYSQSGTYDVSLTVTDSFGTSSQIPYCHELTDIGAPRLRMPRGDSRHLGIETKIGRISGRNVPFPTGRQTSRADSRSP